MAELRCDRTQEQGNIFVHVRNIMSSVCMIACVYKYLMCVSERLMSFVRVWYLPLPPAPVTAPALSYHAAALKSNKCFILILLSLSFMMFFSLLLILL